MGAWGPGLYQDDEACDLRAGVDALLRLPMAVEGFAAALGVAAEGGEALVCRLVLADRLERRGHPNASVFAEAMRIVDDGRDIARLRALGMAEGDLAARARVLSALRARLADPRPDRPRRTLSAPGRLPVRAGDAVLYPVDETGLLNPYLSPALLSARPFRPVGHRAFVVVETGHAFGFLSWIGIQRIDGAFGAEAGPGPLAVRAREGVVRCGTLSPAHFARMRMTRAASLPVPDPPPPYHPGHADGIACAVHGIGIADALREEGTGIP